MNLLNYLFEYYAILAKEIYERYLRNQEPLTSEKAERAIKQYETDEKTEITPYRPVLKAKILKKDFTPSEQYYKWKRFMELKQKEKEKTEKARKKSKKAFLQTTNTVTCALKKELRNDRTLISTVRRYKQYRGLQRDIRRLKNQLEREENQLKEMSIGKLSPEEYQQFKLKRIKALIENYERETNKKIEENHYKRIIENLMRFIKYKIYEGDPI